MMAQHRRSACKHFASRCSPLSLDLLDANAFDNLLQLEFWVKPMLQLHTAITKHPGKIKRPGKIEILMHYYNCAAFAAWSNCTWLKWFRSNLDKPVPGDEKINEFENVTSSPLGCCVSVLICLS